MQKRITMFAPAAFLLVLSVVLGAPRIIQRIALDGPDVGRNQSMTDLNVGNERFVGSGDGEPIREYTAGYRLGECLAAVGCRVFIGTISSRGDAELETGVDAKKAVVYRKLHLAGGEWLLSSGTGETSEIELTSATKPAFSKTTIGPWSAWEDVDVTPGARLLIAIWGEKAQRGVWGGTPEEVAIAVSDSHSVSALENIVEIHKRYELVPQEFVNVPKRLEAKYDSFLLGYVMAYVKKKEEIRSVDAAAIVLTKLQKNRQVPEYVQSDISYQLLGDFYRMSETSRQAATESLVGAGTSDNSNIAESAVYVMIRLSNNKSFDMRPFLTPERRRKLIQRYQSMAAKSDRAEKGHLEFETQLGIGKP